MAKKLTKQINSQFIPTYINGIPQYGFGSWLKKNAGTVGMVTGAGIGAAAGNPMLGAQIGGSLGGAVQAGEEQKAAEQEQLAQIARQNALNASMQMLNPQSQYTPVMACGGKLKKANGGFMTTIGQVPFDNTTIYKAGGSHESNINGGINIGNKALTEEGEVRFKSKKYGDYIFSNRF